MRKISFLFLYFLLLSMGIYAKNYTVLGIGDSSIRFMFNECSYFWKVNETTRIITLPDATKHYMKCYLKSINGKTIHGINKYNIASLVEPALVNSLDAILLNFGCVDIIWHIQKQADKQNKLIEEVVEDLIIPYIDNVLNIRRTFPNFTKPIILMAPTPASTMERVTINNVLNASLRYHALQSNLIFFDPYEPCIDDKGILKPEYDEKDGIHFCAYKNQILIDSLYYFLENLQ